MPEKAAFFYSDQFLLFTSGEKSGLEPELESCYKQEIERKQQEAKQREQADKKYWASFRYLVDVKVVSATSCTFYLDSDDGVDTETIRRDNAQEYGVNKHMEIDVAKCDGGMLPSDAIKVTVNGRPYNPQWSPHNAVIVP